MNWMDNAHLDKALALLGGIKKKYGDALSWGDLITYAGTVAIRSMGGPTRPHCFGRLDESDGTNSEIFGTTANWMDTGCEVQGNCSKTHSGATTIGLIYVNPEGPLADDGKTQNPDPAKSAVEIREVFGRMGFNDSETAAIIAGGHAFGECHAGTSGFVGPWTNTPSKWSYDYLSATVHEKWERVTNGKGKTQWQTVDKSSVHKGTMRLTADLALVNDAKYKSLMEMWDQDHSQFDSAFSAAWDKLMNQGVQWPEEKMCEDLTQKFITPEVITPTMRKEPDDDSSFAHVITAPSLACASFLVLMWMTLF